MANAKTLGTTLNHILNRTGTETLTVTDFSTLKKNRRGLSNSAIQVRA